MFRDWQPNHHFAGFPTCKWPRNWATLDKMIPDIDYFVQRFTIVVKGFVEHLKIHGQ